MQPVYVFNAFLGRDEPTYPHRRYAPAEQLVFTPMPHGGLRATLGAPLWSPEVVAALTLLRSVA